MEGHPVGFLNLRMELPLSPTRTRMYSWFAIDKAAEPEYRKASYETYVRTFGPGGIFDQDDMENWEDCTGGRSWAGSEAPHAASQDGHQPQDRSRLARAGHTTQIVMAR